MRALVPAQPAPYSAGPMTEVYVRKPDFALPIKGTKVPVDDAWLHEVKYDGYRLMVIREGERVRLLSRGGGDYTERFPRIVDAARMNRQGRFIIDGEAVLLGDDGISISTTSAPASTTRRCNSTPSMSWRWAATISGRCRY